MRSLHHNRAGQTGPPNRRGARGVAAVAAIAAAWAASAAHFVPVRTRTGPSQATVLSIAQDRRGFLWIGTQDGLNRFDGYEFKVYTRALGNGLRDNWIGALCAHPDGSLLVGTRAGIDRLDLRSDRFEPVPLGVTGEVGVNQIRVDEDGTVWVASENAGLLRIQPDGRVDRRGTFTDPATGREFPDVKATLHHSDGAVWVATGRAGLHILDRNLATRRIVLADLRSPADGLPLAVRGLIEVADGRVWVASTGGGLLLLDADGNILERHLWHEARRDRLTSLLLDRSGKLWVGTQSGVTEFWPETGRSRHNWPDRADPSCLDDGWVTQLYEDTAGTIWIGTWAAGLYRHNPESDRFRAYKHIGDPSRESMVKVVARDPHGALWISLHREARLLRFDPGREAFREVRYEGMPENTLLTGLAAGNRALYLGWGNGTVDRLPYPPEGDGLAPADRLIPPEAGVGQIEHLTIEGTETLWIGTRDNGLFEVDASSGTILHHYLPGTGGGGDLAGRTVHQILPAGDRQLWLATSGGLQRLDAATGRFHTYTGGKDGEGVLPHPFVTTVLRTSSGQIWVGTQGGGVARLIDVKEPGHFEVVNTSSGLASDAIGFLLEAPDGGIWASTTRGLSRIDPSDLSVINFFPTDGTLEGGFYIGSGAVGPAGRLFFGGLTGLLGVDPTLSHSPQTPPRVELLDIAINGSPLPPPLPREGEAVELPASAYELSFSFVAPGVREPSLTRYAYRLLGHMEEWVEQDAARRFATFFNLRPGRYELQVRARSPRGPWGPALRVTVVKNAPWYWTPTARAGYSVALLCAFALGGARVARRRRLRDLERQRKEDALRDLAFVDQLTRLPNRVRLERHLEKRLARLGPGETVHVLFIDLDHFKEINDSLGHTVGDRVLGRVAQRLFDAIGQDEMVCRWGGDEFVALLENQPPDRVWSTARSVIEVMARPLVIESYEFLVTACVGIAEAPRDGRDAHSVLRAAEAALYHAKQTGRNRWQVYDESIGRKATERLQLERDLREAVATRAIGVLYQPIFDRERRIVAAEALVRWNRPGVGEIPPSDFIRIAEETGIILDLDRLVLETVLRDAASLLARGTPYIRMAVNVSALDFRRPDLADEMLRAIERAVLPPEILEVEVTESLLLAEPENAREQLAKLRNRGISVAIDDFGTGFSALSYLTRLEVDRIKVDHSFVSRIDISTTDRNVVAGVVQIASSLGVEVAAEGVERESQLAILLELGCHAFQGNLLAPPMTLDELAALLRNATAR